MRGATRMKLLNRLLILRFQLTRPMRGATSDILQLRVHVLISTHTPHAGRNRHKPGAVPPHNPFQLTRPMRGATGPYIVVGCVDRNFNSHAPCGAQQSLHSFVPYSPDISTHTPHAGRNPLANVGTSIDVTDFNSHAPCGAQPRIF